MKVKELIQVLSKFDQEAPIYFMEETWGEYYIYKEQAIEKKLLYYNAEIGCITDKNYWALNL